MHNKLSVKFMIMISWFALTFWSNPATMEAFRATIRSNEGSSLLFSDDMVEKESVQ